jgi:hypothetical protein
MISRMPAGLISRAPGTRTARADTRQRRMESLAAEFALLAQRRGRVVHQIDLLDQQREAAAAGLARMLARMAWLTQRMDALDPDLRAGFETGPMLPPLPLQPPPSAAAPAPRPLKQAGFVGPAFVGHAPIVKAVPAGPAAPATRPWVGQKQSGRPASRPRPPTRPGGAPGGRWRT